VEVHAYNPSTGELRQEDCEFKVILVYIASPGLKNKKEEIHKLCWEQNTQKNKDCLHAG
jgi:hypothetical protein